MCSHRCSCVPPPPEPLQLAARVLEGAVPCQSQGAENFHVVEDLLALPIPLLYLVPTKQRRKILRKSGAPSGSLTPAAKGPAPHKEAGGLEVS